MTATQKAAATGLVLGLALIFVGPKFGITYGR